MAFRATNRQDCQNLTVVKLVLVDRKATKIGNQSDRPLGSPRRRKTRELMILQEEESQASITFKNIKIYFSMQRNHRKQGSSSNFYKSKVSKLYKGKRYRTHKLFRIAESTDPRGEDRVNKSLQQHWETTE